MTLALWLACGFLIFALVAHLGSLGLAAFRTARTNVPPIPSPPPPVTILRPVCGLDFEAEATLRSTFALDWPDYEIVFCCASATDPVVPLVERLIAERPDIPARLLTGDDRISINPKLNNLVKGWAAARHDWIVMADSNVILPPVYLRILFARWIPGTGLICSPPIGGRPVGFAAEIECAMLNAYQARWQIAADTVGLGFAQGKTMLWRRDILDRAGGIKALAAEAAEDAAATKVVRRAGLKVRLVPGPFVQPLGARNANAVWGRHLRWARLRRKSFPAFFAPEVVSGGFFPLAVAAILAVADIITVAAFLGLTALWYGAELALARIAGWHRSALSLPAAIVRDLLIPALWVAAWTGNSFTWRGNAMTVADDDRRDGKLANAFRALWDDSSVAARRVLAATRQWRSRRGGET